eukprot:5228091-Pyramimonas_sp.AAC.1
MREAARHFRNRLIKLGDTSVDAQLIVFRSIARAVWRNAFDWLGSFWRPARSPSGTSPSPACRCSYRTPTTSTPTS